MMGGPVAMVFPRSTDETVTRRTGIGRVDRRSGRGVARLRAGGGAAPLLRLMLLRRLGSSLAAFRTRWPVHDAYLDLATRAADGRTSADTAEFRRCFPRPPSPTFSLSCFRCYSKGR